MSLITNLESLAEEYEGFLIDQFGVIMDGGGAYLGAIEAVNYLHENQKPIVFLSNSGRRASQNEARLQKWGFDRQSFISVQSSGETAYNLLKSETQKSDGPKTVYLISREGDQSPIDDLPLKRIENAQDADLILIAGSEGDLYPIEYYQERLEPAAKLGIPAICSNPDQIMLTGNGPHFGAAKIAEAYESSGGKVKFVGKPYPDIYKDATSKLGDIDAQKIICIGDSIHHDLQGASNFGYDCALVQTGLSQGQTEDQILSKAQAIRLQPKYILPRFAL